jgi:hypothetical protein
MTTVLLDIIAATIAPEAPEEAPEPPPEAAAGTGEVYVIHTAPGGRLDPSSKDLAKVEIVSELEDPALDTFIARPKA